tara:strand:+ start:352 stop:702 length:351 start_codon:yes stop_codon:yes gene_type:complete
VLAVAVTLARGKFNVLTGIPSDPSNTLYKLIRAHDNTVEYAPILALLIYILGQNSPSVWVEWFMILVTFSRYLIVAGIVIPQTLAKSNPMRFIGAMGTYIFGLALCFALAQQAIIS